MVNNKNIIIIIKLAIGLMSFELCPILTGFPTVQDTLHLDLANSQLSFIGTYTFDPSQPC